MVSRPIIRLVTALAFGLLIVVPPKGGLADYWVPEIELVPVERIAANLERRARRFRETGETDEYLQVRAQLARVYALAYARRAAELEVTKDGGDLFEGPGWVPAIPYSAYGTPVARPPEVYLRSALTLYAEVIAADPSDPRVRLGYAWTLEESGDTDAAIAQYREVFAMAWPEDKDMETLEYGARPISQEAALRLIDLLDPRTDAAEIARLERRSAKLDRINRWITPIMIPLADGLAFDELIDPAAAVGFDLDGSGRPRKWRWITPQAAWLVWDPAGGGRIESGLQHFGAVTFWLFWDNGYEALDALDDDGDGHLAGPELRGLALWRDADGDGRSDPGEVRPLEAWGISALATARSRHPLGFPYSPHGVVLDDGRRRASYDWMVPAAPAQLSALR